MIAPQELTEELVTANHILARERVLASFGHISGRNPDKPDRYFLSRARAPELAENPDIMEFMLDGKVVGLLESPVLTPDVGVALAVVDDRGVHHLLL